MPDEPKAPYRIGPERLVVPFSAFTDGIYADGAREIGPDDPEYDEWDALVPRVEPPPTPERNP